MATKKDMRRGDLVVPYLPSEKDKDSSDFQSTVSSTLPMVAMFTRNKLIGWASVIFSLQNWLAETPAQKSAASSPAYMSIGMSVMAMGVGYLPYFLPPGRGGIGGVPASGTEAPAASPL